ncbi:MAG: type II CAAX prenyl endopeptidase Rce1 family protein [Phycisphaerae bacterium]
MSHRGRQLFVFGSLIATNALLVFAVFALGLPNQLMAGQEIPEPLASMPGWLLSLANAGIVLVLYGLLGLAGVWFARKLSLPGIYREGAGWRQWVVAPMVIGVALGVVLIVGDSLFARASEDWAGFPHPEFPLSIIASATAGIGEEVLFRLFVMGLWAFLLNLALRRWEAGRLALWAGNVIAALAFGAAHLPVTMMAMGVSTPAELPPVVIAEVFVLSGIVGIVVGQRYMREGLIAAVGIHFWADVVWHILWPAVHAA